MRWISLLVLLTVAAGCDTQAPAEYTGPADYAYTLDVSCFCAYTGPIRVSVEGGQVVDATALRDTEGTPQSVIDRAALSLEALTALAARAEREADDVTVRYDATYGFPTRLDIDWERNASDDEVAYTATDYALR